MSRSSAGPLATRGCYTLGDKVEVLSSEEGFSDAWATATVVGQSKAGWQVEYNKFVDSDGKSLREKARACRRFAPPDSPPLPACVVRG